MTGLRFYSHHKCATTWLRAYLARICSDHALSYADTHYSRELPDADVVFLTNASYAFVSAQGVTGCHVIRNPLSVVASAYFSHRNTHSLDGWPQLAVQRALLRETDQSTGLCLTLAFLERADFCHGAIGPLYAMRCWDYDDPGFLNLRMEDLVRQPQENLTLALKFTGETRIANLPDEREFTFAAFADGRSVGQISDCSHFRSGDPQGWRRVLPPPVIGYVRAHFGAVLERFYPDALGDC